MEKIAVFINDAAHALHILQPMVNGGSATHWVLVACPPKLTRHIGRWVAKPARDQWRERWANELFNQLAPMLKTPSSSVVEKLLARRALIEVSTRLQARLSPLHLLDARRPTLGRIDEPITAGQPADGAARWAAPVAAVAGLGAVLTLSD